jgi:hypothetical protein
MNASARLSRHLQRLTPAQMAFASERAGIARRVGAQARKSKRISATPYMLLCAASGLDPVSGDLVAVFPRAGASIHWCAFAAALLITRQVRRLGIRSAARQAGVSIATLSRAENGKPIAVESFLRIAIFIGVPAGSFLCFTENTNCNTLHSKGLPAQDNQGVSLGNNVSASL